jgi:hypothetical protein
MGKTGDGLMCELKMDILARLSEMLLDNNEMGCGEV